MDQRLLVIDDSEELAEMIADHFDELGYSVDVAYNGRDAVDVLARGFSGVILLDYRLPDVDGLELLDKIADLPVTAKVVMITAHASIGMAMEAVQSKGAFYVHSKGEESMLERLTGTVTNAFAQLNLEKKLQSLEDQMGSRYSFANIITQSREMQAIFKTLEHVVESKVAVLVQGESGTGKELIAKAVHFNGPRTKEPFIAINCAGIPDTLLESELLGYEKGAFTGAYSRKKGKFEAAHKGTLFLDEIGEMNLALQSKILRVLQEKSFERIGGNDTINVDVRIISATNKDLEAEVAAGRFREDLYYRLSVFPIHLPPLRERREDVPMLARHFLTKSAEEEGKEIEGFTQRALDRMVAFDFPGNVRQLENIISHAAVVCTGNKLDIPDLPAYLRKGPAGTGPLAFQGDLGLTTGGGEIRPLKEVEDMAIKNALEACNNNVSLAARLLGVSRATIYRKVGVPDS